MRLWMALTLAAILALGPATLRAQGLPTTGSVPSNTGQTRADQNYGDAYITALTATSVSKALPLLTGEAAGRLPGDDRLAQVGMTKAEYGALKASLMVARLDAQEPARLHALSPARRQVRQANVLRYQAQKAMLDGALSKLAPPPGCGDCKSPAGTTAPRT